MVVDSHSAPAHLRWPGVSIEVDDCGGKYYFDAAAADRACSFFPLFLTHHKGEFAGQPFELAPWQSELLVRPWAGWKRRSDGLRRFRWIYLEVPKKNGKSQLASGFGLLLTFADHEPGAEVLCCAADKDNGRLVFDEAKNMVEDDEILSAQAEVFTSSIVVDSTRSAFKVLSAEARTKHGPNIHGLIIDELHAQPDRELFDTLTKGIAARRQPLVLMITTAGDDLESICYEQHEHARRVQKDQTVDETFLPVIFAAPAEGDAWRDPAVLAACNPGFGVTVKPDYIESELAKAIVEPRRQNAFKRLHANIWTQQHTAWLDVAQWEACEVPALAGLGNPDKLPCFGGLDLSSKIDLTALVLAIRVEDAAGAAPVVVEVAPAAAGAEGDQAQPRRLTLNYRVRFVPFFWMPEETLAKRVKEDAIPYDVWRDLGFLRVTPGDIVDYDLILEQIADEIGPAFGISEIGYDPWNASQFALNLQTKGFTVTEVPNNYRHLSEPSKVFEALNVSGRALHDGNAVMHRCVENVAIIEDRAENIRPVKPSKKKRIDGVVGGILALSRLIVAKPPKRSRYVSGPTSPLWAR